MKTYTQNTIYAPLSLSPLTICIPFQALVIDYKLTYPSGTATAVLINGFHTPQGEKNAKYKPLVPHMLKKSSVLTIHGEFMA